MLVMACRPLLAVVAAAFAVAGGLRGRIGAARSTFKKDRAYCHGTAAKGDGPLTPKGMTMPADLTDEKWDSAGRPTVRSLRSS